MASRTLPDSSRPGDVLVVVHEFQARSPDELSLARGDRIELIERDDDFGDGWFLGRNTETGNSGLFPEVYTRPTPKLAATTPLQQRAPAQPSSDSRPLQHGTQANHPPLTPSAIPEPPNTQLPATSGPSASPQPQDAMTGAGTHTSPLQFTSVNGGSQTNATSRTTMPTSAPRSISMALSGEIPHEEESIGNPVMHETLSVIDEHITDMSTPRHSIVSKDLRGNDSGSEYSSHRLSYIHGHETEEEEQNLHTEAEVTSWSPARVAEYLEDVGVEKKHCDIFREQEINGEVLLGMDQATIFLKEFELGPVGPRLRTWLKIKNLQQEVKTVRDANKSVASLDGLEDPTADSLRNRATSMGAAMPRIPSLREGPVTGMRHPLPRSNTTAGHSPALASEASPLSQLSPNSPQAGPPARPSAASIRSLNHNRRHSSNDYALSPPITGKAPAGAPMNHKKTPSFDRNWSMGSPQKSPQPHEPKRPSSSNHMHNVSTDSTAFSFTNREPALSPPAAADLDRGYFSGGELDNRKARNVLRKKEGTSHSQNPSYSTEAGRRAAYNRRHSRIGSTDSAAESLSPVSPAAKAYYGSSVKSHRSSSVFEYVRPLKPTNETNPTVTKLEYGDSPSIDAIARSPNVPGSEASSHGHESSSSIIQNGSFFGKKSRSLGLRAISDAITGTERAHASSADITSSPIKESPVQSPTRTGSSTPSGASMSKSFELDNPESNKRFTGGSTSTTGRRKSKKHGTSAYTKGRQTITPQEALIGCDYSGWMKKKSSSLMTTWKTRLFVLRGRRLSYFYTEYDSEEKGLIDISSHRVLPANNEKLTGFHATITRASSSPSSPQNATIPTAASTDSAKGVEEDMSGMFIFKLVPPRAGLQKGVQFTKPIVHYFAVDSIQLGRLWMAALMKATIDRDDSLSITTTYQQKTISLDKARAMRQRPPALMDLDDDDNASSGKRSKESIQEDVIHEEDEKGLAISGLDDAKAMLEFAEKSEEVQETPTPKSPTVAESPRKRKESISNKFTPGLISPVG